MKMSEARKRAKKHKQVAKADKADKTPEKERQVPEQAEVVERSTSEKAQVAAESVAVKPADPQSEAAPVLDDADQAVDAVAVETVKHKPSPGKYDQPQLQVVVYRMAENEYVLDAGDVVEIFQPDDLIHLEGLPDYVAGLSKRRGRIVPVVDLRKKLHLSILPQTEETCVIVVKLAVDWVGFLVDAAVGMLWVNTQDFEVPSQVIAGIDQDYLRGVALLEDRLLMMLDFNRVLSREEQAELDQLGELTADKQTLFSGEIEASAEQQGGDARETRSLLTFGLDEEMYGLPVSEVESLNEPVPITPLPHAPAHLLGLANLQGMVMPVVDLRVKFGLKTRSQDSNTRFIVLKNNAGKGSIILWADFESEIVRLPQSAFQPAPEVESRIDTKYCHQVTMQNNKMLIELDMPKIIVDIAERAVEGDTIS